MKVPSMKVSVHMVKVKYNTAIVGIMRVILIKD
jgi:hypothetical protein